MAKGIIKKAAKKVGKKVARKAVNAGIKYATYAAKSISYDRKKREAQYEADKKKYGGGNFFMR